MALLEPGANVAATLSDGTHIVTATVVDSGGGIGTDQITVTLGGTPNIAPSVTITAPDSGASVVEGNAFTFAGTANDTEDGDLSGTIAWNSNIDGSLAACRT